MCGGSWLIVPILWKLRKADWHEFKASLNNIVRSCLKKMNERERERVIVKHLAFAY